MTVHPFDPDGPGTGDGLFGLPHTPADAAVVVVPVPFEATASYRRGTAGAPEAIFAASQQVDLHDHETGSPWQAGIAMESIDPRIPQWNDDARSDALAVIHAGGLDPQALDPLIAEACARVDMLSALVDTRVHARVADLLALGTIPGVLGGDHSVARGAIEAAAAHLDGLGVLQIDAHADLREAYLGFTFSHASVMFNVLQRKPGIARLVQVGIRDVGLAESARMEADDRIVAFHDADLAWELSDGIPWRELAHRIVDPLPRDVWVSFDIDGLDPSLCPNTGTPVPGGLTWRQATVLLRVLAESGRHIVGFDICEVAPGKDEWDAIVGARLLYKLAGWAIATREKS